MKNSIQKIILKMPSILETIVAAILLIAVVYGGIGLIVDSIDFAKGNYSVYLENVLKDAFGVIIVIEFVRMLIKHSMNTIVEVLIFTIARGLVIDHESAMQILIQVIAIAILLICMKHFTNDTEYDQQHE